jgi:hypothetical protein
MGQQERLGRRALRRGVVLVDRVANMIAHGGKSLSGGFVDEERDGFSLRIVSVTVLCLL